MTEDLAIIEERKARARLRAKLWGRRYRARARENALRWARENPERRREIKSRSLAKRYSENPRLRILMCLRSRLFQALRGKNKSAQTLELLGCSLDRLRVHLESQFQPGMTWENHGPAWHVDHIRPCTSFDLADPAQQRACFHHTNLQPLFALENMKKGGRY